MVVRSKRYTEKQFIEAVKSSITVADVIRKLGLQVRPGNYQTVYRLVGKLNLDTSHWDPASVIAKTIEKNRIKNTRSLKEIMVQNSDYNNSHLKNRLLKEDLLKSKCYDCGISEWKGRKLSLQLDHINGISNDNRIENLRLLCPNCHSLTPTFCRRKNKEITKCLDCQKEITKKSKRCKSCAGKKSKKTKIKWPSIEKIEKMVAETSYVQVGKKLGVSDNAVRKFLKRG